jgi:CRP-like cAMP-binding protein
MSAVKLKPMFKNRLLASLSTEVREQVAPHLETVSLKVRHRLEIANRKINDIYFIESGICSVVAAAADGRRQANVAIIGHEGISGLAVIMGADRTPYETFIQLEVKAQRLSADALRQLMRASTRLTEHLLHYAHVFYVQVAHTALANAHGKIEERLARWLLMVHDRLEGDEVALTHETLAVMLGVRRAGVTIALHVLESAALISTVRGTITILDRDGLHKLADGSYGAPELEYSRLFGAIKAD